MLGRSSYRQTGTGSGEPASGGKKQHARKGLPRKESVLSS